LGDPLDEIRGVGEVDVVDPELKTCIDDPIRVPAIDLERPGGVDQNVGPYGPQLVLNVAVTVKADRYLGRARRERGAESGRLVTGSSGDEEREADLIRKKARQAPAERAVAAEDQDRGRGGLHGRSLRSTLQRDSFLGALRIAEGAIHSARPHSAGDSERRCWRGCPSRDRNAGSGKRCSMSGGRERRSLPCSTPAGSGPRPHR
jgi:hypothetical protein